MKQKIQLTAGIVSLVGLLTYTLVHTGGLLSVYVYPQIVGYVAAFGIELSIVSLSLRIGDLRKSKQNTRFFLFVLSSVVIVSAIANIAEGFYTSEGVKLTLETMNRLDMLQSIIGLSATGLISLIVLALSEIVGTDVVTMVKQIEKERKHELSQNLSHTVVSDNIVTAREKKQEMDSQLIEKRHEKILSLLKQSPETKPIELAQHVDVSRQTIYRDLQSLVDSQVLEKNGQGYIVRTN